MVFFRNTKTPEIQETLINSILTDDTEGYINTDQVDQFCNRFDMRTICDLSRKGMKKAFGFAVLSILILIIACATAPPPRTAEDHLLRGEVLARKGNTDEGIVEFQKAIEMDSQYAAAYTSLGAAYGQKGMIEQSISASKKAIEQDPQNATAYYNLGNAFGKRGNYEEAFAAFFKAVELDPGYAGPHYGLAVCYYATGHYELAVEHADKAEALGFKVPWRFRRSLKKALRKSG
jgi:tetratricopeptide (TPR) repeat protein